MMPFSEKIIIMNTNILPKQITRPVCRVSHLPDQPAFSGTKVGYPIQGAWNEKNILDFEPVDPNCFC